MDLSTARQATSDAAQNLNLGVLQRKDPSIVRIVDTAAHVVAYRYNDERQCWEKKGVEGSLFVFERSEAPRYGFFIMNRINLENIMELVTSNMRFKISEPYLLYKNPLGEIVGIWFHSEADRKRIGTFLESVSDPSGTVTPTAAAAPPPSATAAAQSQNILSLLQNAAGGAGPPRQTASPAPVPHPGAMPPMPMADGMTLPMYPQQMASPIMQPAHVHTPQGALPPRYPALTQQHARGPPPPQPQPQPQPEYNVAATSDLMRMLNRAAEEKEEPAANDPKQLEKQLQSLLLGNKGTATAAVVAAKKAEAQAAQPKARAANAHFTQAAMIPTQARTAARKKVTQAEPMTKEQLREALVKQLQGDDCLMSALYAEYLAQFEAAASAR